MFTRETTTRAVENIYRFLYVYHHPHLYSIQAFIAVSSTHTRQTGTLYRIR